MHFENNYLVFDNEYLRSGKKISGHSFVGLISYDKFNPIGNVLLKMFNFVKEPIDSKYIYRGDYAEKIVKRIYEKDNHNCTVYDKKEINYDNFQNYQRCGGLIDIELLDEQTLIEVKSKSMKDFDRVTKTIPIQEVYQGLYYGYLRNYKKITMEYIFFDEQTEAEIFNQQKPTTLANLKRFSATFDVNVSEMYQLINKALNELDKFYKERRISLDLITDEYLELLGLRRP